jgi:hypothetical protein
MWVGGISQAERQVAYNGNSPHLDTEDVTGDDVKLRGVKCRVDGTAGVSISQGN